MPPSLRSALATIVVLAAVVFGSAAGILAAVSQAEAQGTPTLPESVRPPAGATIGEPPNRPTNIQPKASDSDIWRAIRRGGQGGASGEASDDNPGSAVMPLAGTGGLIQSEGELWREMRGGPYRQYAGIFLAAIVALLALFFALRGRVRIAHGRSDTTVVRFGGIERFAHWLTAISFIVLAVTGLQLMFGRELIIPLLGKARFAELAILGKAAHNYVGFGFMVGLALMFILWVWHNLPHPRDIVWFLKGGGIIGTGHPHSKKFNAGQKIIFWLVILGGSSLSASGWALLVPPYDLHLFSTSFAALNDWFNLDLPAQLTATQELQLNQLWHGAVAVVMIGVILCHIYIGSVGMEGAFAAMGRGRVDLNWAREHHDLWVEELERKGKVPPAPAE